MAESSAEFRSVPSEAETAAAKRRLERNLESRRVRVFISSTFSDCHGERDSLQRIIAPALRAWCSSLRPEPLDFSVLDLRWGITSEQVQSGDVLRLCLDEVGRCQPFFIAILTMRYGWHNVRKVTGVDDSQSRADNELLDRCFATAAREYRWLENYTDRSLTEVEIRHGTLRHPQLMRNRALFYFRTPSNDSAVTPFASTRSGLTEASSESFSASIKQLELKKEIEKAFPYSIKHYSTLAEFNQLVEADLKEVILAAHAATSRDYNLLDIARSVQREGCLQMNALEEVRLLQESYGRSCCQNFVACQGAILNALAGYVSQSSAKPATSRHASTARHGSDTAALMHSIPGGAAETVCAAASPQADWTSAGREPSPAHKVSDGEFYGRSTRCLLSELDVDDSYLADWDDTAGDTGTTDEHKRADVSPDWFTQSEAVNDGASPCQPASDRVQPDDADSPQQRQDFPRQDEGNGDRYPIATQTSKSLKEEYDALAYVSSAFIDSGHLPADKVGYQRTASGTLLRDGDDDDDDEGECAFLTSSTDESDSARVLGGVTRAFTEDVTTSKRLWSSVFARASSDSILSELDSRLRPNTPKIVTGVSGCGKSYLLAHVAELARKDGHVVCTHFTSCAAGEDGAEQVMSSILYQAKCAGMPLPKEPPDPSNLAATFHQLLKGDFPNTSDDGPEEAVFASSRDNNNSESADNGSKLLVVIIDALDMVRAAAGCSQLSLAWLSRQLGRDVRLLVSTAPGQVLNRLRDERGWEVLELSPIGQGPRRDIVTSYLNRMGKTLDDAKLEKIVHSEQTSNPLFLTSLLKELCMCATYESLQEILESYLRARTAVELFDLILQRWEQDYSPALLQTQVDMTVIAGQHTANSSLCPDGTPKAEALKKNVVRNILLSLCLSSRGMREQELQRAWQVTAGVVSPLLYAAGDSLLCRTSGCLVIGRSVLERACRRRYLVNQHGRRNSVEKAIRDHLAGYFEERCSDNVRRCEELPRQLVALSSHVHRKGMRRFLSQLSTLAVFTGAGRTYDLLHYWRIVGDYQDAREGYLTRLANKYGRLLDEPIYETADEDPDDVMVCRTKVIKSAVAEDPAVVARDGELASDLLFVGKILCAMGDYASAVKLLKQRLHLLVHHGGRCCADSVRASLDLAFFSWKAMAEGRDKAYTVSVQYCIQALCGVDQCADDGDEMEESAGEVQSRIYELLGNLHYKMGESLEKGSKHMQEQLESARIFLLLAARYWLMSTAKRNRIVCYATLAEIDILEGEVGRALKLAQRAVKASCQEFGEYHHVTARIRTIYASILKECSRLEEAQHQMQMVSKVQVHLVGLEHRDTKASLKSVSELDEQIVRVRSDSDGLSAIVRVRSDSDGLSARRISR